MEKIMKKNLIIVAIVTILLSITAINANANPGTFDNTFSFSGNFGLQNPCNAEIVQGPIQIHIVVTTTQTGNGDIKVNVHHSSHGLLTGSQGNEYEISRTAKGQFNAVSPAYPLGGYVIPWRGEFVGKGTAPNFIADGELRVWVNAQNEPIGSQLVLPINRTCS